jgi:hypothetical protein
MGNLWYLVLVVCLSVLAGAAVWAIRNRPRSMQSSMDAFHRELAAIAPREATRQRRRTEGVDVHVEDVQPIPLRSRAVRRTADVGPTTGAAVAGGRSPRRDRDGAIDPLGRRPGRPVS